MSEPVAPYFFPLDDQRPVLVCGHEKSGKELFVNHVLTNSRDRAPITLIDPTGRDAFDFGSRPVEKVSLGSDVSERDFFIEASRVVGNFATSSDHGVLVLDEFLLLTEPYQNAVGEQETFTYVLGEALLRARQYRARIIMVSTRIPPKTELARFGCRYMIGAVLPMDWVMLFGRQQPAVEAENRPGTGVLALDRHYEVIRFPLGPPEPSAEPEKARRSWFGRSS